MASIFASEQAHLTKVYHQLEDMRDTLNAQLTANKTQGFATKEQLDQELTLNFDTDIKTMETYADIEAINHEIDIVNHNHDISTGQLSKVTTLLTQPYFAKVDLKFSADEQPESYYIGTVGVDDDAGEPLVLDWRSPIAATYYQQDNGPTSYEANGQIIQTVLTGRRQFDIDHDNLRAYFDTTITIEDPLLRDALSAHNNATMTAITATIQKTQNAIVRAPNDPVMLVNGIAGSGKTSVMLQRVAYLLYQHRETLSPEDIYFFTPSLTFQHYISAVLPNLGETNPISLTWDQFIEDIPDLPSTLAKSETTSRNQLDQLIANLDQVTLTPSDVSPVTLLGNTALNTADILAIDQQFNHLPMGQQRLKAVQDVIALRCQDFLRTLATDKQTQDTVLSLSPTQQEHYFGHHVDPQTDDQVHQLTLQYLQQRASTKSQNAKAYQWLNFEALGKRLLHINHLTVAAWLLLKIFLTGYGNQRAKLVLIDEVQDYSEVQLMVLRHFFSKARFIMLGDENQAITSDKANFDALRSIFNTPQHPVVTYDLTTSYRSTAEITALFSQLADNAAVIQPTSVQDNGTAPAITVTQNSQDTMTQLQNQLTSFTALPGLTAVITNTAQTATALAASLQAFSPTLITSDKPLPTTGLVVLPLDLAKGLEFGNVILPDATTAEYPATSLARHRLYTAISRATHHVALIAQDTLTPLLGMQG
ncbi:hypothetical protein AYR62_08990 [Secundilactobacillus paracollinoides]|uniref:HelD family protein n=1 Tax=Secundilactobacillus paracollinoides TaxID=240427 RepID=UPI00081AA5CC|nr:UvrD-helicase domain-containing protein [Secundilactobacillus paracollinoides]ANZ64192.1 hypothetical protein AYR62_08990 [Secundilactobacillus paracollinoides]